MKHGFHDLYLFFHAENREQGVSMKKHSRILRGAAFLTLCLALFAACPSDTKPDTQFTAAPVLQATAGNKRLTLQWTASVPAADSYDIYYREGNYDAAGIKGGIRIQNVASPDFITNLKNDTLYSVLVTAKKSGYESIDSIMVQETPGLTFTSPVSLTLENITDGLICNWSATVPAASSYDIYYRQGSYNLANQVKEGIKITGKTSGDVIEGLTNGETYSVVITANLDGYRSSTSAVRIMTVKTTGLSAPIFSLIPYDDSLICSWAHSTPEADTYDIYWKQGTHATAAAVKEGTRIADAVNGQMISGLTNGVTYSVVLTANKTGYTGSESLVKNGTPAMQTKSPKRGVSYNFTDGANTPAADMNLLGPGVSWFYNWGQSINGTVYTEAKSRNIDFVPMIWGTKRNDPPPNITEVTSYLDNNPGVEYILAFNEPNLTDQVDRTPAQGVPLWTQALELANAKGKKLVSPAMNYGTLANYSDPIKWLGEFYGLRTVSEQGAIVDYDGYPGVSFEDVDAISVHCYMPWPGALKSYIGRYRTEFKDKNGATLAKPIWMTEFCGWEVHDSGLVITPEYQMYHMSQAITYMELDPAVEKYAWFIPKGMGGNSGAYPYMALLTATNPPELTPLGVVFVNMSTCDKNVFSAAGTQIAASKFTDCNISDDIGENKWKVWHDSVNFRPTTDAAGYSVLDIWNFKNDMWVEYQVNLTQDKEYTLTLRNKPDSITNMTVEVDGASRATPSLAASATWRDDNVSLGNLSAGQHKIRLKVTGGNCALNWLKVE